MTVLGTKACKRLGLAAVTLASVAALMACGNKQSASTDKKSEINWYTPTEIITLDISKIQIPILLWLLVILAVTFAC